jgi:nicotinamidase-related amidase
VCFSNTAHHVESIVGPVVVHRRKRNRPTPAVLTGISTNAGVESTLRQRTGLGFAFIVAENACSGQDGEEHRFAFERIFPRLAASAPLA